MRRTTLKLLEKFLKEGKIALGPWIIQSVSLLFAIWLAVSAVLIVWLKEYILLQLGLAAIFILLFLNKDIQNYWEVTFLQEANQKLKHLNEVTEALRSTFKLEDVLKLILTGITRELGFDRAFIFLRQLAEDGNNEYLGGTIGIGVPTELLTIFRFPIDLDKNEIVVRTAKEKQPFIIKNAKEHPECNKNFASMLDLNEFATIPLEAKDYVVGVLVVDKTSRAKSTSITEEELSLLGVFANQAAIAIENAKLYGRIEKLSRTDGLTDLFNHTYFYEQLKKEVERAKRLNEPLSLVMMDIDDFKGYNDSYGHQAGNELLKKLSGIIKSSIRKIDIASRYGGEEFAVILPATTMSGALSFAEKLRKKIEEYKYPCDVKDCKSLTVSIGVASLTDNANTTKLVECADKALYLAKRTGKNRVCSVDSNPVKA